MSDRGDPVDTSAWTYEDRVRACIARLTNVQAQLSHDQHHLVPIDLVNECVDCLTEYLNEGTA